MMCCFAVAESPHRKPYLKHALFVHRQVPRMAGSVMGPGKMLATSAAGVPRHGPVHGELAIATWARSARPVCPSYLPEHLSRCPPARRSPAAHGGGRTPRCVVRDRARHLNYWRTHLPFPKHLLLIAGERRHQITDDTARARLDLHRDRHAGRPVDASLLPALDDILWDLPVSGCGALPLQIVERADIV